jgi:hypothetical protein
MLILDVWEFTSVSGRALSTRGIPLIAHPVQGDCHFGLDGVAFYEAIKTALDKARKSYGQLCARTNCEIIGVIADLLVSKDGALHVCH